MAQIVIVTKQCYLVCESINYISICEDTEKPKNSLFHGAPKKKSSKGKAARSNKENSLYKLIIDFTPIAQNPNNSRSSSGSNTVSLDVLGERTCMALFKDMVGQIREQSPDKLYLDKLVENFFAANPTDDKS